MLSRPKCSCSFHCSPSLVYFGSAFPCTVQPQFTPNLFVYGRVGVDAASPLKYEHWRLGLSSISLVDADAPDDVLTIDLTSRTSVQSPNDSDNCDPADKVPCNYAQVILDTGAVPSHYHAARRDIAFGVRCTDRYLVQARRTASFPGALCRKSPPPGYETRKS